MCSSGGQDSGVCRQSDISRLLPRVAVGWRLPHCWCQVSRLLLISVSCFLNGHIYWSQSPRRGCLPGEFLSTPVLCVLDSSIGCPVSDLPASVPSIPAMGSTRYLTAVAESLIILLLLHSLAEKTLTVTHIRNVFRSTALTSLLHAQASADCIVIFVNENWNKN